MPFKIPTRDARRILLVEFNPYQILVADLRRTETGDVVVEAVAEFDRDDLDGLNARFARVNRGRTAVICSLVPEQGIVHRELVQPALLSEPGYLGDLVQEQQKGRFLTATPFKIFKDDAWTFRCVDPANGTPLPAAGPERPALICAVANKEILEAQMQFVSHRLVRERIEPGMLSMFSAVYSHIERRGGLNAVAVVVILESATAVYILGKDGVHTPNPVMHGMNSIVELGRKEFGALDETEVLRELQKPNAIAKSQAHRLVRRISRDLKPVVDAFEMSTGQPVDEMFCAYLPPKLAWMAEPLARSTGRHPYAADINEWLPANRVQAAPGVPEFGLQWLGVLAVAADLPQDFAERKARGRAAAPRPWHVDCSVAVTEDEREYALRRKVTGVAAAVVAAMAIGSAAGLWYALNALRADTALLEQQLAGNQKQFQEMNTANTLLKKQSGTLDRAYELMAEPFQLTEFLLNLGRTIPARMRVDKIDSNDSRVTISGMMLEPDAELAARTLGRYAEELRRDAAIGHLFSNIAITTMQRRAGSEDMIFELTLRIKGPTP